MFVPNSSCRVQRNGGYDEYGMVVPGIETVERCTVVKLEVISEKSSVRADSSASRGNASELQAKSVILFPPKANIEIDDIITLPECKLRVVGVTPRRTLQGRLDHFEVSAHFWSQNE